MFLRHMCLFLGHVFEFGAEKSTAFVNICNFLITLMQQRKYKRTNFFYLEIMKLSIIQITTDEFYLYSPTAGYARPEVTISKAQIQETYKCDIDSILKPLKWCK